MNEKSEISEKEKWNALINCDKSYDGLFYYAVKSTGIFCRPSCKAKAPLLKNTLFFNSIDEAVKNGFRPCKMCRPDIIEPVYEPNRDIVDRTRDILNNSYSESVALKDIASSIGVSCSHLTRLFKQYYSATPNEYIIKIRIDKSLELLRETNMDIFEIVQDVGFKSMSNFYKCFKENTGYSPGEYRKINSIKEELL